MPEAVAASAAPNIVEIWRALQPRGMGEDCPRPSLLDVLCLSISRTLPEYPRVWAKTQRVVGVELCSMLRL